MTTFSKALLEKCTEMGGFSVLRSILVAVLRRQGCWPVALQGKGVPISVGTGGSWGVRVQAACFCTTRCRFGGPSMWSAPHGPWLWMTGPETLEKIQLVFQVWASGMTCNPHWHDS